MLSIEKTGVAGISVIKELTEKIWPQTYSSILSAEQIAYMMDMMYGTEALRSQIEDQNHRFILCYDDGKPVAFASYSEKEPGLFRLHKIYVLPGLQGKGVGKALIDYIVDDIKPQKAQVLELNVNRCNKAKDFYSRLGFTVFREEDIDIGGGYFMNDYVMRLAIS
jgi:GNAT superfamily N-acetyltransferase